MTTEATRRFPWGLTIVCALAFALLCSLGVWQVQRMQWKEGLIAEAEAAATHPPVPVMQVYKPRHEFRSVIIDCPGLATAPFVEMHTIENGEVGVRLISACALPSKPFVTLVDRGFVPESISARPPVTPSTTPTRRGCCTGMSSPPTFFSNTPGRVIRVIPGGCCSPTSGSPRPSTTPGT